MTEKFPFCESCPLIDRPLVPGSGIKGGLAIVGEAPGRQEVQERKPFIGMSGILLRKLLEEVGIDETQVWITNSCLCQPSRNDTPPNSAIDACNDRLMEELQGCTKILTLGATALTAIYGPTSIMSVRGARLWIDDLEVYCIPTYHPAAVLRAPDYFPDLMSDLQLLAECPTEYEEPEAPPEYVVVETLEDIRKMVYKIALHEPTHIALDLETTGLDEIEDEILVMGIYDGMEIFIILGDLLYGNRDALAVLHDFLESDENVWVAQNGPQFDRKFIKYQLGINWDIDFDTMLAHYCVTPSMRVLKTDMTWIEAGQLNKGDEVVAFDEKFVRGTTMKPATVLATKWQTAPTYRITTSQGSIECSGNHLWPVKMYQQGQTVWRTTKQLLKSKGQKSLMLFVEPWEVATSYEAGYIAGILDGEGCLAQGNKKWANWNLSFSQLPGEVLDRTNTYLTQKGFEFTYYARPASQVVHIKFNTRETLRMLGTFNPARLKVTAEMWQGRRKFTPIPIESIEYLGEQEVVGIETSAGTYIVEGFLTHNCLDERQGSHGLKTLARKYFQAGEYDSAIKGSKGKLSELPLDQLYQYLAYDVYYTHKLAWILAGELNEQGLRYIHDNILLPAAHALGEIEYAGVNIDQHHLKVLGKKLEKDIAAATIELQIEAQNPKFNPNSPKQVADYLYGNLKLRPVGTKTGKVELAELNHPFATSILELRQKQKLLSTYVRGLLERVSADGRIRASFLLHGTVTGRLSSRDPNLQNIPARAGVIIRDAFVATPGWTLLEADYNQLELRIAAYYSRDRKLCETFANEEDIHARVARDIFGLGPNDQVTQDQRYGAKFVDFGILYGRGAKSLAEGELNCSIRKAQSYLNNFLGGFPELHKWMLSNQKLAVKQGYIESAFGRKRRFALVTEKNKHEIERQAINAPIQSAASDLNLMSLTRLHARLDPAIAHILITVHDSLLFEVKKGYEEEIMDIIYEEMVDNAPLSDAPFAWSIEVKRGIRWGSLTKIKR